MPLSAPRSATTGLLVLASGLACGRSAPEALPRLTQTQGVDPFVLERIETALEACERGATGARLELAKVYDANGLHELALETYDLCLRVGDEPRTTIVYLRAVALETLGRSGEALDALRDALRLDPAYAPSRWRAGQLLLELGRIPEARAELEAALALEPRSIPATLGLARALLLESDAAGALARLEPLAQANPGERFVHGLLARAYRALGREDEARRALQREERATRVSLADPRAAEVATRATGLLVGLEAANGALARGEPAAAVATLEGLLARAPEDLAVRQMLAKALIEGGAFARALELLEESARTRPDEFKTELFLGLAHEGQKALREAREHLQRSAVLNPAYGPTHAALGELEAKLGRHSAAEAALLRALECGADDLRTRCLLVQVQLEQDAFARAAASAEETRTAFPNAVAAWTYLAEARARLGETDAARSALAEAERRNPDYERLARVRALLAPR